MTTRTLSGHPCSSATSISRSSSSRGRRLLGRAEGRAARAEGEARADGLVGRAEVGREADRGAPDLAEEGGSSART